MCRVLPVNAVMNATICNLARTIRWLPLRVVSSLGLLNGKLAWGRSDPKAVATESPG
jgi:hypothetical protein